MSLGPTHDVIVVGGGMAGACTAAVLGRRGLRVLVVDPHQHFPRLFRAEKVEPAQAELLRKLQLLDGVLPATRVISEIVRAKAGRVRARRRVQQLGISYQDLVDAVRAQIPASVEFQIGKVDKILSDASEPAVVLTNGERKRARLIVVATGMGQGPQDSLECRRISIQDGLSLVYGFVIERRDGDEFPFDAVTYRPNSISDRVGYLTLFRMGDVLRANYFTYWDARDTNAREMQRAPVQVLQRTLPGLENVIGPIVVTGRVETFRIDLYRYEACARAGVVLLGDAFQSVCPSTGMGLSKVLTDVDVLCNDCLPSWFAADTIDVAAIERYYANPRKQQTDGAAIASALSGRESVLNDSLRWRFRRFTRDLEWSLGR